MVINEEEDEYRKRGSQDLTETKVFPRESGTLSLLFSAPRPRAINTSNAMAHYENPLFTTSFLLSHDRTNEREGLKPVILVPLLLQEAGGSERCWPLSTVTGSRVISVVRYKFFLDASFHIDNA